MPRMRWRLIFLQKQALVDFERTVAREFSLLEALDSLDRGGELPEERRVPAAADRARATLSARLSGCGFQYAVEIRCPQPHSGLQGLRPRDDLSNPSGPLPGEAVAGDIPRCVAAGLRPRRRGRYCYYAGGYATAVEARLACELLLKRGFRRPEIVRWVDGEREDFPMDGSDAGSFRVEISGANGLSEPVRTAIREAAPDKELARVGTVYIVGSFSDRPKPNRWCGPSGRRMPHGEAEVKEISAE